MPWHYLVASQDDTSVISCYQKGDRVHADLSNKNSLPLLATNRTKDTTFLLKHLDHFVEDTSVPASETETGQEKHGTVLCNECRLGIKGIRYKCLQCVNYDLCAKCHGKGDAVHDILHTMLYIPKPNNLVHTASCDGCRVKIKGLRFKCLDCRNYDLCEQCSYHPPASHNKSHRLAFCTRIVETASTVTSEPPAGTERTIPKTRTESLENVGQAAMEEGGKHLVDELLDSLFN